MGGCCLQIAINNACGGRLALVLALAFGWVMVVLGYRIVCSPPETEKQGGTNTEKRQGQDDKEELSFSLN